MRSLFSIWALSLSSSSTTGKLTGAECIDANDHRLASELFKESDEPF